MDKQRNQDLQRETQGPPPVEAQPTRFIPVTRWSEFHEWPTTAGLRGIAARGHAGSWLLRVGRRLIVDEQALLRWIRERAAAAEGGAS